MSVPALLLFAAACGAMVTGVDAQFGRILSGQDELDLTDDTSVLFTSDHGDCLGSHEEVSKNNHFEESLRVPFLIRWPGRIPARPDDLLLSVPDIYPTVLELLNLADPFLLQNIAAEHPEIFERLVVTEFVPWLEKNGDPWLDS